MKTFAISLLVAQAAAFPAVLEMLAADGLNQAVKMPRDTFKVSKRADNATQAISQAIGNCGTIPCLVFNAKEQFVSTTGDHAFIAPGPSDTRGVCPGLNAAANHNYLPRSGFATIGDTIQGLGALYGMSPDLAGFLAAYAIVFAGDPIGMRWSIGGPIDGAQLPLLGGIIGKGQGINNAHNKYEGDTSITRPDKFIDPTGKQMPDLNKARNVIASGGEEDRITIDSLRQVVAQNQHISITQNPHYFAPLFSTTLVVPAAYNFVVNFMSNRTAEEPNGYLTADIFKTFFALEGDGDSLSHNPGMERIPDNWYRRTITNPYTVPNVFQDLITGWLAYPDSFRFGGNTNGVDTYRGVDIQTLTSGKYSADGLFEGNNFACLVFQAQQQAVPDFLGPLLGDLTAITSLLNKNIGPLLTSFGCPELAALDNSAFQGFTGAQDK